MMELVVTVMTGAMLILIVVVVLAIVLLPAMHSKAMGDSWGEALFPYVAIAVFLVLAFFVGKAVHP